MELRPYQCSSMSTLKSAYKKSKRVLFVLPTGGGKTAVFTHIAQSSPKRVLILAHRKELIEQISERLEAPHGIIMSSVPPNYAERIQVGSVQSVVKRLSNISPEFIIIDEAHHAVAGQYEKIIEAFPDAFILGVTATPCRLDGKGLAHAFDTMVEGPSIKELIGLGYLCPAKVYASEVDLAKVRTVGGDYNRSDLEERMTKTKIVGDVVNTWRKYANDKQTIVFCVSIKHAVMVTNLFNLLGHKAESISSENSKEEREAIIVNFKEKRTKLLVSVDIISEGFDVPSCEAVVLLRPTKSLSLYMQQVGRGLRTFEGKQHAIILDHAGNCFKHGLPTQHREWELTHDKVKAAQQQKWELRQCKKCYAVFSTAQDRCPECGSIPEAKPKDLKMVAGELVPVEEVELKKKEARRELAGEKTLQDWINIANKRGYKIGWAYHRFNARQK
jgi:DNA repair protein RadD